MTTEYDSTDISKDLKQDRAIRLFRYLKELAQLRTKPVRDCNSYEWVLWFKDIPREPGCYTAAWGSDKAESDDIWIEIKRRREPKCPNVPEICEDWVELKTVFNSDKEPELRDWILAPKPAAADLEQESESENEEYREPAFLELKDYPEVEEEWLNYLINKWEPWAEEHRRWKSVQKVYSDLFTMYQQQKRLGEDYELVLGIGLLVWKTPSNQRVRRHLLVGQANLNLDPEKGIIKVERSAEGTRLALEMDMLEPGERPPSGAENELEGLIDQVSETPFAREQVDPIIRSWINLVDPEGVYIEALEPPTEFKPNPQASFAPAIILRKRTARTLVRSYSTIINQIEDSGEVPIGVQRFCEIMEDDFSPGDSDIYPPEKGKGDKANGQIYLPLPANEEQLEIVEQLRCRQGILVQGPPGTGKSHTIANLICHLLATGRRILITSQGPRALKVLAGMLPPEIASLCVSVLGNDASAMDNLERSVHGVTERYYKWNRTTAQKEIDQLYNQVDKLKRAQADIERRLRELREIETYEHNVAKGVYRGTAQTIAKALAREAGTHGWIPDNIDETADMPFDVSVFSYFLHALREISDKRGEELRQPTVPIQELPTMADFINLVEAEKHAARALSYHEARKSSPEFTLLAATDKSLRFGAKRAMQALQAAIKTTEKRREPWINRAVSEILTDHDLPWKDLRNTTDQYLEGLREQAQGAAAREISLPEGKDRLEVRADAEKLLGHIEAKGKIGIWVFQKKEIKRTRYLTEHVRVNGRLCNDAASLEGLIATLCVEQSLERLWKAWSGLTNRVTGLYTYQVSTLEEHLEALDTALALEEPLQEAKDAINRIDGLPEPAWNDLLSIQALLDDHEAVEANEAYSNAKASIDGHLNRVRAFAANPHAHPVNICAVEALKKRDENAWGEVIAELTEREDDRLKLEKQTGLLSDLDKVAPILAKALTQDPQEPYWDERINGLNEAWAWKQADTWLRRFWEGHQQEQLEAAYKSNQKELEKATANLASAKAWLFCFERMTEGQREHLVAWMKAVQKFGKGKSKYIEKYRREAQKNMEACRGAIPAWIMPFYRVVDTIDPSPNMFDVVIIDEASQSGPDALLLIYLAKQCIVVGDDQQISPEAVGINLADVNLIKERYLKDIPISEHFGLDNSLFSLAEIKYPGRIILREHFRCMPEIIHFSNALCYSSTPLQPLRQYPPKRLEPIICRHVPDGYREGGTKAVNKPEAEAMVEAIAECCSKPAYKDKTMGVISLQDEYQAQIIERMLLDRIGPEEFEKRELVCGDAYAFQGDERDIMFLSLVAAPNVTIGPLVKESYKRRFNVATSRAKDQVWLFHTATLNDLNKECMRYKLLDYYQNPQPIQYDEIDPSVFESKFEEDVFERIVSRGYRVIPQFKVAKYRIDLVVEGTKTRLAIECDGDEFHGADQYEKDMARQRNLERCKWTFWRVRGSKFYRYPDTALEPLWQKLEEMEIYPRQPDKDKHEPPPCEDEPLDDDQAREEYGESQTEDYGSDSGDEAIGSDGKDGTGRRQAWMDENYTKVIYPETARGDEDTQDRETRTTTKRYFKDDSLNNPKLWEAMGEWGKETNLLTQEERSVIWNVCQVMDDDWFLERSERKSAEEIAQKAFGLGFHFDPSDED